MLDAKKYDRISSDFKDKVKIMIRLPFWDSYLMGHHKLVNI